MVTNLISARKAMSLNIPVEKVKRFNIFGMIDRNNRFEEFRTRESVDAAKVVDFLDRFSFNKTPRHHIFFFIRLIGVLN